MHRPVLQLRALTVRFNHPATVVIISGKMGARGTVFKSSDHGMHLTDLFVDFNAITAQQVRA